MRVKISIFTMPVVVSFIVIFALGSPAWSQGISAATPWTKRCTDESNAASCSMIQQQFLVKIVNGKEQKAGRLLQITILYAQGAKKRVPAISLQLPLGVNLQAGVVVRIDKGKEFVLPYLRCRKFGCDVSTGINTQLLASLKKGSQMLVGFVAWGGTNTNLMKVSLKGFTNMYNQLR